MKRQRLNRRGIRALVAALSGLLWVFAAADFDWWPLAYVALLPLLWLIDRAAHVKEALLYGWLAGLFANMGGFYWIILLLERYAAMPWPVAVLALILLSAYQGLVWALFASAVHILRHRGPTRDGQHRRSGMPAVVAAPLCMVTFELAVPFIFPWYLAIAQAQVAPMIQIAEFTGPLGVTAAICVIGGGLYDVMTAAGWRRRLLCGAGAALLVSLVLVFGWQRLRHVDRIRATAPMLRVGVVQGNQPMAMATATGAQDRSVSIRQLRDLQRVSAELEGEGAELIVWSESSYPFALDRRMQADFAADRPYRIRRGFSAPLIFGATTIATSAKKRDGARGGTEASTSDADAGSRYPYNSALMLGRDDMLVGRYDKVYRLIFGEYIPGLETFPSLRSLLPAAASHFAAGTKPTVFELERADGARYRLGPLICYEDILPRFVRELGRLSPHVLVNITNDTWFGDSSEPWQHLALSVFRAVELRVDLVRAVNSGVSAIVDAGGRVLVHTEVNDPFLAHHDASGMIGEVALVAGGQTFYARYGDVFGYGMAAVTLCLLLWAWYRRFGRQRDER